MEHLEIEFKMLLKENIFKKLLSFSSSIGKEKILTQN